VGLEGSDDVIGADIDIVIAEDAEPLRRFECGKDFSGDAGGLPGDSKCEWAAADEIASNQDQVRGEGVDLGHHVLEEVGLGELLQVEVAHLNDTKVLKAVGKVANGDGQTGDFELVARMGSRVDADAEARSGKGCPKKAAAGEMK